MSKFACEHCANTGILGAKLMRDDKGKKYIAAKVCGVHFNNELSEKNLSAMHESSGLPIEVKVEKPE